jgi:hypothetical protein
MEKGAFFIVSRYDEDIAWLQFYPIKYIILQSTAGHEAVVLNYIYNNYNNLPNLLGILQADPFPHCVNKVLRKLVENTEFTFLETAEFREANTSFYVPSTYVNRNITCKYESYDEFMNKFFKGYNHIPIIRFCAGTQYIVERERIQYYSKSFWKKLADELPRYNMTEGYLVERAMSYIFQNTYEER